MGKRYRETDRQAKKGPLSLSLSLCFAHSKFKEGKNLLFHSSTSRLHSSALLSTVTIRGLGRETHKKKRHGRRGGHKKGI